MESIVGKYCLTVHKFIDEGALYFIDNDYSEFLNLFNEFIEELSKLCKKIKIEINKDAYNNYIRIRDNYDKLESFEILENIRYKPFIFSNKIESEIEISLEDIKSSKFCQCNISQFKNQTDCVIF